MQPNGNNKAVATPQNKMINDTDNRTADDNGVSISALKTARRLQAECNEPFTSKHFLITNLGNGEWQLVLLSSGKSERVK